MSIYKIESEKLVKLLDTSFESEMIYEEKNLQKYLVNSINILESKDQNDSKLLVISTEFSNWEDSKRSIDILCIDSEANIVVVEIKRTKDGGFMELQALRYAAMVSNMKFEEAVKTYENYLLKAESKITNAEGEILNFLKDKESAKDDFGQTVKIILISADFSKELTTSILWLNEKDIDIKCFRMKPQKDNDTVYLDIQQIIPIPEAADYQVKLKEKTAEEREIRKENKRTESIIKKLFNKNLLKINQTVILKPAQEQNHPINLISARIVTDGLNCLQRDGDTNLYSFSKLRAILTKELGLKNVKPEWGFTLKNDWITENGEELAELEKKISN